MIAGIAAAFIDPLLVNDGFWDSDSNSLAGATRLEPNAPVAALVPRHHRVVGRLGTGVEGGIRGHGRLRKSVALYSR